MRHGPSSCSTNCHRVHPVEPIFRNNIIPTLVLYSLRQLFRFYRLVSAAIRPSWYATVVQGYEFGFLNRNLIASECWGPPPFLKFVSEWVSQRKHYSLMSLLFSCILQFLSFNSASMINGLSPYISVTALCWMRLALINHADVIKWKHLQRYWPFVRGIHRSPVNSPHKSQWRGALMFSLICARITDE